MGMTWERWTWPGGPFHRAQRRPRFVARTMDTRAAALSSTGKLPPGFMTLTRPGPPRCAGCGAQAW